MYTGLHVKYPLCFSDFNETWTATADFRKKKIIYYISWKPLLWEPSCSMRMAYRHGKDNSRFFRQFCDRPSKFNVLHTLYLCFVRIWE